MFTIYFHKKAPLYEQIYSHIVQEIQEGRIQSQEKLPSQRSLAQHLGVGLNTVKLAYEQLLLEGYIVSKERSGFYVDLLMADRLKGQKKEREIEIPEKISYKWDFSYHAIDKDRLPLWVMEKSMGKSMEKAVFSKGKEKGGTWSLRKELAHYLARRRGLEVNPRNILITSGYGESLFLLLSVLKHPIFSTENPGYTKTLKIIQSFTEEIHSIPLDKYGFSVADLEQTNSNVAVVTPNHQFPTGMVMGIRRRQRLLEWARKKEDRYIIEDDYDGDFSYSSKPIPPLKGMDIDDRVIFSGTFSQSIGPFVGISYIVLPEILRKRFENMYIPILGASPLLEYFLEEFLSSGDFDRHVNRMNNLYRKKNEKIRKLLREKVDFEILGQEMGLHFLLRVHSFFGNPLEIEEQGKKKGIKIESLHRYEKDSKRLQKMEEAVKDLEELFP